MSGFIRGILFDLGDTLLNFGKVDTRGVFEAGAELSYAYLSERGFPLPSFSAYHRRQFRAIRWSVLKSRVTCREFSSLDLIRRTSRRMGHGLTEEQVLELAWKWYEPLRNCATVAPGTREVLSDLAGRGLSLGVVSNTFIPGQVLDRHLEMEGLLELLPARVYSCDVGYRKPSRRIFRIALDRAALPPEQTLFVGNLPRPDIAGARRAGLIPILKDPENHHEHTRTRPRHRIRDLRELPGLVEQYAGGPPAADD